ncbi:hypothetical protein HKO22_00630 [Peptoniphilus sp. AGMB00490]|uniref:Bacteriophage Mu Gam like protein n=1 Tax=Peptoniphilus faecalis TaxID=2731255 RepID=A0A848R8V3_9FIRM|nr:host-nuclease inhibitor Gam family protein [Peptoniphilus faecalis]NMW84248.1 hypothetical protein [Peptoniphilus faecalis]
MENLKIFDDIEDVEDVEERETFEIKDLAGCDWCFEKLKAIKKQKDEFIEYADEQIKRYENFKEERIKKAEDDEAYFKGLIQIYTDKRLAEDKNFKLKTVEGTASYGKVQKKWNYDEDLLLKDLEDKHLDEYIKIKKSVDKSKLKKSLKVAGDSVVDENGEIIEGIKITEYRNFNVKY